MIPTSSRAAAEQRVRALLDAVRAAVESPEAGRDWLQAPNGALGGIEPLVAA